MGRESAKQYMRLNDGHTVGFVRIVYYSVDPTIGGVPKEPPARQSGEERTWVWLQATLVEDKGDDMSQ